MVRFRYACVDPAVRDHGRAHADTNRMVLRYWIVLNAMDAVLTGLAISLGALEANLILNLFAARIGIAGMLFVKTLMAISIGGVLWERGMFSALSKLNVAMIGVVIYNMLVITYGL